MEIAEKTREKGHLGFKRLSNFSEAIDCKTLQEWATKRKTEKQEDRAAKKLEMEVNKSTLDLHPKMKNNMRVTRRIALGSLIIVAAQTIFGVVTYNSMNENIEDMTKQSNQLQEELSDLQEKYHQLNRLFLEQTQHNEDDPSNNSGASSGTE